MTEQRGNDKIIFNFPEGLPGFESLSQFRFLPEKEVPLARLISSEIEDVGFILMRPEIYFPGYLQEIKIEDNVSEVIKAAEKTPIDIWVILKLCQQDLSKTTANLRAPLLFNMEKRLGHQYILNDDKYTSAAPVFLAKDINARPEGAVD